MVVLTGIIAVHLLLLFKLKFTAWPEMLLWPYLMIKGWLPYQNIAIAHTPLLLTELWLFFKLFGAGVVQLKIFTWLLVLILDGLLFWVAKKLWNTKVAIFSLLAFVFWQLFFDGNGLWFDLYMGVWALITFYLVRKKDWFAAGIFWALALISKQTAVWFLIPIFLNRVNIKKFFSGTFLVILVSAVLLLLFGVFGDFWRWAVTFGVFELPKAAGQVQLPAIREIAVIAFVFSILIWRRDFILWAIAGALGAYPRFELFHFQPALPYLAIATALVFSGSKSKDLLLRIFIPVYILGSIYLFANFFMRNWGEGTRFYEQNVVDVSSYVKNNTKAGDKIFVMNWWDNIYPLTGTLPATDPWVPQLSWYMDRPGIQNKMIADFKNSKPKLIILNPYTEIGLSSYKPEKVYDYVIANYKLKEKVDGIEILEPK